MEYYQTDPFSDVESTVGTGQPAEEAQPTWVVDGFGVRGPQKPVLRPMAEPEPIVIEVTPRFRQEEIISGVPSPPCYSLNCDGGVPIPCLGGACCSDFTCYQVADAAACQLIGGTYGPIYHGDGTCCPDAFHWCEAPSGFYMCADYVVSCVSGACCAVGGGCFDVNSPTGCDTSFGPGNFLGFGTSCAQNYPCGHDCWSNFGACCFAHCPCYLTSEASCVDAGGFFQGDGTSCCSGCPIQTPQICDEDLPHVCCCPGGGGFTCSAGGSCSCEGGFPLFITSCDPDPCNYGICCSSYDGVCDFHVSTQSKATCASLPDGFFVGYPCAAPDGCVDLGCECPNTMCVSDFPDGSGCYCSGCGIEDCYLSGECFSTNETHCLNCGGDWCGCDFCADGTGCYPPP